MTVDRLVSLAAGINPELADEPLVHITAAAHAGWPAAGVWYDPDSWTPRTARILRRRFRDLGLIALDMEVIKIGPQDDHGDAIVDAASELGASNLLAISLFTDPAQTLQRFAELCERAKPAGIRVCLEFMRFTPVRTLQDALAIVSQADQDNAGILVDLLHLVRSGGTFNEVRSAPQGLFPYAQWCDAPAEPAGWSDAEIITDALDARCPPGEGELNASDFAKLFDPGVPFSMEVRSKALRESFPNPKDRACHLLAATNRALE